MGTLQRAFVLLAVLGSVAVVQPALADDADRSFEQGTTALKAGKYEDARHAFEAVWKQRKTHDVAANLALAELQLGKHRDAAEHFAFALRNFPVTGDQAIRKGIEGAFADAKKHVMTLRVIVSIDGAEVTIDRSVVGRSPIADEIFVEPGARTIEARLPGHVTAVQKLEAKQGASDKIELALRPEDQVVPERSRLPSYIAFGAGGAGLVVGAITGAVSIAKFGDMKKVCGEALICPPSQQGEIDTGRALGHVSTAGFVVAGLGAAVGVTLLLLPTGPAPRATAGLTLGPTFVGVKGTF